ncbi:DNA polymerase subunit gamma-1, mitochondrial [Armadillidium nasatum]|uniref:DNA-directed DNA polymerase n=1 Tax=Armadillidium nasatum TaxID=96803 RepID=A0A5N5TLK9_9CRUS|nr:DNA polymerase subunit gamma-1, mitochondrial [Armadillidium nasatum]
MFPFILLRNFSSVQNFKDIRKGILKLKCNDSIKYGKNIVSVSPSNENTKSILKPRISKLNIQMLSQPLYDQLFKDEILKHKEYSEDISHCITHLQKNGLWGKESSMCPDINFSLPPLKAKNLIDHFYILGKSQSAPYTALINTLVSCSLPDMPNKFSYSHGWTKYHSNGKRESVTHPSCPRLVFDIEVCMSEGKHPTLACAVSDKYWYTWCSEYLIDETLKKPEVFTMKNLIPLECEKSYNENKHYPRIVIGHNVSFDRIAVREQYHLKNSKLRFLDTMSLHIAVSGLVEEQRRIIMKNKTSDKKIRLPWMNVGCMNSLKDVYKFYCKEELKKETRDIFVKGSLNDVRENFHELMSYCAKDVIATKNVVSKVFPIFLERFPHPVTLAGMLEMSTTYLPVSENWNKYISKSEEKFNDFNYILNTKLSEQAVNALELLKEEQYKKDPWLWDLDWNLPKRVKKLKNLPNWYRKLCMKNTDADSTTPYSMSTSLQVVPKLLRLTWNGYPLHYDSDAGWGYLKPMKSQKCNKTEKELNNNNNTFPYESLVNLTKSVKDINDPNELPGIDIGIPNVIYHPLPHKNGEGYRVGNPLSKDFLGKLEDNTLSSAVGEIAQLVLKTTKTISYWKNNRDRILSQTVINLDHDHLPSIVKESDEYNSDAEYGAILPQVVTAGTITRRAVEKTWMTASNAYAHRIGSELKSMICAPPGYNFVGADVDSQELWIASVLGDTYFSMHHGSTALGWMTLQGSKSEGTDMHSRTAKIAGISRDNAKVINYGRIYGAGLKFIKQLLKQFNPSLSDEEVSKKASKLFAETKGEKGWYLNSQGVELAENVGYKYEGEALSNREILKLMRMGRKEGYDYSKVELIKGNQVWTGGSESHMFNCLEKIANMNRPRTPVLEARITRALEPWCVEDQFMTSRINWVVQSSAVDFLHLMLVSMKWLMEEYDIKGRFSISIHDEVRYLVASEDKYRAALALHVTNLLTRSFIAMRLGMNDLPMAVAFFSGVDIDTVLRKEPDMDCVTPSNPDGLSGGYNISKGETLNIYEVLEKTGGCLSA